MSSLATVPQAEFGLKLLTGPEKGATFKLLGQRITIGRGSDNNIVISDDPKISRHHATLTLVENGYQISDISENKKVYVNGKPVSATHLIDGAIIQLGETRFQFKSLSSRQQMTEAPSTDLPKLRHSRRQKKSKLNFYMILALVGAFLYWVLSSDVNKKKASSIKTESDVLTTINANQKVVEEAEAERRQLGLNTPQYQEAQPYFIKGFRDYRKGQYERAIESFNVCLSSFPGHIQCRRYLQLSQKKFSELVQYHMFLATKYRSQNQFAACMASYRNAMYMIKNPSDKVYQEAQAGYRACQVLDGERY